MPVLKAPLLSFAARGSLGGQLVFAQGASLAIVRGAALGKGPDTAEVLKTRAIYSKFCQMWRASGPLSRAPWLAFGQRKRRPVINEYLAENMRRLRHLPEMSAFQCTPNENDDLQPKKIAAAWNPVTGLVDVTLTPRPAPPGWVTEEAVAVCFHNQMPWVPFVGAIPETSRPSEPWQLSLPGPGLSGNAIVQGWYRYTKPNGKAAFARKKSTVVAIP